MSNNTANNAQDEMQKRKDPAYDPTDEPGYVRREFRIGFEDTKATTIAATYAAGKSSQVIYDAKISEDGLKCFHCYMTVCNPCSCALCNHDALKKYTFTRLYDDHVETNVPVSCLCWILDLTAVYYLDRDWAQKFEKTGFCTPILTHCMVTTDCMGAIGNTVIGHGSTNGVCCPGGRRIAIPLANPGCSGGPFFFGFCPIGDEQWVCFPLIDKDGVDEFIAKLTAQRQAIVSQYNIVASKSGVAKAPASVEQSRA